MLREASGAIASIVERNSDNQLAIRRLSGIPRLVELCSHLNELVKDQACAAIRALVKGNSKIQNELRSTVCITALINNLQEIQSDRVREHSAGALLELARNNERNARLIVDGGSIPLLVAGLTSASAVLQYLSSGAIWALSIEHKNIRAAFREANAIQHLTHLHQTSENPKVKEGSQWALAVLQ